MVVRYCTSWVLGVDFLQVGQSPLRARVRLGDTTPEHLLPPLLVGGLLEAAASGFNGKQAGGQSCQDAAPTINDQRQVDRRLQHYLETEAEDQPRMVSLPGFRRKKTLEAWSNPPGLN